MFLSLYAAVSYLEPQSAAVAAGGPAAYDLAARPSGDPVLLSFYARALCRSIVFRLLCAYL